jgi:hypothetical protein
VAKELKEQLAQRLLVLVPARLESFKIVGKWGYFAILRRQSAIVELL